MVYQNKADRFARLRADYADAKAGGSYTPDRVTEHRDGPSLAWVVIGFAVLIGAVIIAVGFGWGSEILEKWK